MNKCKRSDLLWAAVIPLVLIVTGVIVLILLVLGHISDIPNYPRQWWALLSFGALLFGPLLMWVYILDSCQHQSRRC